jgi:hypothetical protein
MLWLVLAAMVLGNWWEANSVRQKLNALHNELDPILKEMRARKRV